jgi:type II secretory pathway predicted ATPase ExeA
MYESFFGFSERPFQLTPNPRFLFLNPAHREALATLRYGLTSSLGITLLLGDAGTGKTTLLHAALQAERRPEHRYALLSNPTLAAADFYEILARAFGLPDISGSKGRFLLAFERDLAERHKAGGLTALVIDEAQSLSLELFEEIRLLANLETETAKLVNVVLVGQRELAVRLNDPALRQFKQRVILRCALPPLDLESTASYIAMRLRVAGAHAADVFTPDAVVAIYGASHGIPRVIGVICENALLAGYAAQKKPIDRAVVTAVCRDFDLPVNDNGQPHREDRAAHDPGVAAAPAPDVAAARETQDSPAIRLRPGRSRPLFSFRNGESRPGPAKESAEAAPVRDRTRIFDFF